MRKTFLNMELVQCKEKYWEFVRNLRNDERVSNGFIDSSHITYQMQIEYMNFNAQYYRVALVNGDPAGYFGVINEDIRICTHPDFQGKGVGKFMIQEGMKIWANAIAKVKVDNIASLKLFKSLGFTEKYIILTKNNL